jgi:subtilisin-like proprotein convertase family protein
LSSPPNFSPAQALTNFDGDNSSGDWTVTIIDDDAGENEGTFLSATLRLCRQPPG